MKTSGEIGRFFTSCCRCKGGWSEVSGRPAVGGSGRTEKKTAREALTYVKVVLGRAQELGSLGVLGLLAPELRNPAPDAPAKEKRVRRSAKIARACVPGEDEGGIGKYPSSAICHCLPRRTQGAQSRRREVLKGSPRARLAEHRKCASGQHALRPLRLKRSESAPSPRWSCTRSLNFLAAAFALSRPEKKSRLRKSLEKSRVFRGISGFRPEIRFEVRERNSGGVLGIERPLGKGEGRELLAWHA